MCKINMLVWLLSTLCFLSWTRAEVDYPVVNITHGSIMGRKFTSSWTNQTMYAFQGIPYATAPTGSLRFQDPTTPQNWTDVKNCTVDGSACMQIASDFGAAPATMSEDCLFINVYSPEISPTGALWPVMVWVHGGGWVIGAGSYDQYGPDMLVAEGVVVVTLNYRLGAFGFLSLGNSEVPGNSGLKDQVFALKWVQSEIRKFGGDQNRVTLAGESAGSFSVHLHYLSPLSKGLFHRVIGESGDSNKNAARQSGAEYGLQLAELLNCSTADAASALSCLQAASADDVVAMQSLISCSFEDNIAADIQVWRAVVDKETSPEPFLPAMPFELYEQNQGSFVPFIMGTNRDEGVLKISDETFIKNITNNLQYLISEAVRNASTEQEITTKTKEIDKFYFNGTSPSYRNIEGYLELYTDVMMAYCTSLSVRRFRSRDEVYVYKFVYNGGFKSDWTLTKEALMNTSLVSHAEELNYLFVINGINQTASEDSADMKTWRRMVRLWTNFIKYGTPTTSVADDTLGVDVFWDPVESNTTRYLEIDTELTMVDSDYIAASAALWDSVLALPSGSPLVLANTKHIMMILAVVQIFTL